MQWFYNKSKFILLLLTSLLLSIIFLAPYQFSWFRREFIIVKIAPIRHDNNLTCFTVQWSDINILHLGIIAYGWESPF